MIKNYFSLIISILLLFSGTNNVFAAKAASLPNPKKITFAKLARIAVEDYLGNKKTVFKNFVLTDNYTDRPKGVFVTITGKDNKSFGCWGSLNPPIDLKIAIASSAVDAVKKDYRTKLLSLSDLNKVKFQVAIVTNILPISSFKYINPIKDGLMVRAGGRTGIILPGESVDSYYQMVQARLKAGIASKESCNMFKLVTKLYKE